ncbi:MAG: DoxX family membrane protein [Chloroflexi bacterium]|nr:DoxX family membrane protein [Chloroflexota bacterium]
MAQHIVKTTSGRIVEDPPLARFLFSDTRFAAVWTVIRVLIGYSWLTAGWAKVNEASWMQTGAALQGYWTNAVAIPATGHPAITFDWYRAFIQGMLDSGSYVWFAKLVAFGELFVGIALITGAFVGLAAFFAALMNWNYIMAGSTSSNPLLLIGAVVLILAWKTAGYYGLDFFLLPRLGTPWSRRKSEERAPQEQKPAHNIA